MQRKGRMRESLEPESIKIKIEGAEASLSITAHERWLRRRVSSVSVAVFHFSRRRFITGGRS